MVTFDEHYGNGLVCVIVECASPYECKQVLIPKAEFDALCAKEEEI